MQDVSKLFFNHAVSEVEDTPQDILEQMLNAVDASSRVNSLSSFVINFDTHELIYRADRLIYLDELSHKDFQRDCANPYWSIISEDTLEKLLAIKDKYVAINEALSREDYQKHICTIDYPISIRGHEFYITQRFTPLILRPDGITKIGLFTIANSSRHEMDSMIIAPTGQRWKFDFEDNCYKEYDLGVTLSLVEKAILQRAQKGMTSEEIAQNLYISINTVKTHRMKIFKKLGVETIAEALTVVGNYQLL